MIGIPLPARDEIYNEYEKSLEWKRIFAEEFGNFYKEWLPKEVESSEALNKLFIPYVTNWSFGERIPVLESARELQDPTTIGAAYARLSALISNRLDWNSLESKAGTDELQGTRVELQRARAALEAHRGKQRRLIWATLVMTLLLSITGYYVYGKFFRPDPVSTELFVGDDYRRDGKLNEALAVFQARKKLLEKIIANDPKDDGNNRELGVTLNRIGDVYESQGKLDDALTNFQAGKAIMDRLTAKDPSNTDWQRDLAVTQNRIALVLLAQGQPRESLNSFKAAAAIRKKISGQSPTNALWKRELLEVFRGTSQALLAQGNIDAALESAETSRQLYESITPQKGADAFWQPEGALIYEQLGNVFKAQGKHNEALKAFRTSRNILEKLTRLSLKHAGWKKDFERVTATLSQEERQ